MRKSVYGFTAYILLDKHFFVFFEGHQLKKFASGLALGAILLTSSIAAQDAKTSAEDDGVIPELEEATPTASPPPPIATLPTPRVANSPAALPTVPTPLPRNLSTPSIVPQTNIRGPYPANQRPVTDFLGNESKLEWQQAPFLLLPGLLEEGQKRVVEGETLFEMPLLWSQAAYLDSEVKIEGVGDSKIFERGSILPATVLRTENGIDQRYTLFCNYNRVAESYRDPVFEFLNSARDARWCLQDTDGDGTLDIAVVLSAGAPVKKAADIEPVPYEMRYGQSDPESENYVSFTLERVGRKTVRIRLDVVQFGDERPFQTLTTGPYQARRLNDIDYEAGRIGRGAILGINFGVREANRKDNLAEIDWVTQSSARRQVLVIPRTVTYSYY